MKVSRAADRYAKALIGLAKEQGSVERVHSDMKAIRDTMEGSRDLVTLMKNPIISTEKKRVIFERIFGADLADISLNFVRLIFRKNREKIMGSIATAFIEHYKELHNIVTAELVTAGALDEDSRNQVLARIREAEGTEQVEMHEKQDPELIGGFILRIGDRQVDASVKKQLRDMKRRLSGSLLMN